MNEARLPWTKLAPKTYQAMANVSAATATSPLGMLLIELVQTRISQINGCAFCLDMHVRDLRKHGETWKRINSLPTWREVTLYTERERAALRWAEALTQLAGGHGDHDGAFAGLNGHFSEQEIVDLTWVVAQINAWNRMAIGMHQPASGEELV
jgi:AhpD family alkylhydroperoxidase